VAGSLAGSTETPYLIALLMFLRLFSENFRKEHLRAFAQIEHHDPFVLLIAKAGVDQSREVQTTRKDPPASPMLPPQEDRRRRFS